MADTSLPPVTDGSSPKAQPIEDDNIRVVMPLPSPADRAAERQKALYRSRRRMVWYIVVFAIILGVIGWVVYSQTRIVDDLDNVPTGESTTHRYSPIGPINGKGYVTVKDTMVQGMELRIWHIIGGRASLCVGEPDRQDSDIIFCCQAAGTRGDTGGILGTFVDHGQLLSTGSTKAGYCSIIDGTIEIGIKRESSRLEEALNKQGYFFRQYPLIISSEIIDNKQPGESRRRALCLVGNEKYVAISLDAVKLNDFSAALYELKVTEALYLVGGDTYGWGRRRNGAVTSFGDPAEPVAPNDNFILWTNR